MTILPWKAREKRGGLVGNSNQQSREVSIEKERPILP
jgi:hypothetical protein